MRIQRNQLLKNGQRFDDSLPKKIGMASKHMKRWQKEIQIKTSTRYHYTQISIAELKKLIIPSVKEDIEQLEHL